jgi:AcrR family transcriptional regulator
VPNKRSEGKRLAPLSERRDEILEAAGQLFSQRGFHATSMRDLAQAVNLQGGSLYAHIDSKEELLLELVNRAAARFIAAAEAVPATLSSPERLERLVRGHLEVIAEELGSATVFFHEWKFLSPELQARVKALRDTYEAYWLEAIGEGVRRGELKVDDVRVATLFVLSALNWTYQWYQPGGKLSLGALSEQYSQLILSALQAV